MKCFFLELQPQVDAELNGISTLADVVASLHVLQSEDGVMGIGDVACPQVHGSNAEVGLGMKPQECIELL